MICVNEDTFKKGLKRSSTIVAVFLIFSGFFGMFTLFKFDIRDIILNLYMMIFGVVIIAGEFNKLKEHFGFASTFIGRGVFQLFIGMSILAYKNGDKISLEYIAGILVIIIGIFQMMMFFSCTKFRTEKPQKQNITQQNGTVEFETIDIHNDSAPAYNS